MNIQEILKKAKERGAEAVRSALEELRQENQAITAEARAAYDAYFGDVLQRVSRGIRTWYVESRVTWRI